MSVKGLDYLKSAERWQRYGETYHDEARTYYSELNKTALTIGTFLLGFIGIFIRLDNIKAEPFCNKILLIIGFFSLIVSIVLGLRIFSMMNDFLNKAGDYYEQLSKNLHLWMIKNNKDYGYKYPEEISKGISLKIQASNTLSKIQLFLLGIGFICVGVYFFLYLIS